MDQAERRKRMAMVRARVRANPVSRWAARCLGNGEAELVGARPTGRISFRVTPPSPGVGS
jgi:hypothetical protein